MKKLDTEILNKKCFIFDIDGTLVDSMGMWNIVDQQVIFDLIQEECSLMDIKMFRDHVLYSNQGYPGDLYMLYYEEVIKSFELPVSVEEFRNRRSDYSKFLSVNKIGYKKGAAEFLKLLKAMGKKLGVATTTTRRQYEIYEGQNKQMMADAPLKKLIDVSVVLEDVRNKKPDPEAYLKVMQKLGVKPSDCVIFEDSFNGVLAGKEAGADVVAIYDEFAANEQDLIDKIADYKAESFEEIIQVLGMRKGQGSLE